MAEHFFRHTNLPKGLNVLKDVLPRNVEKVMKPKHGILGLNIVNIAVGVFSFSFSIGTSTSGWRKIFPKFKKLEGTFERKIKSMRGERFRACSALFHSVQSGSVC